MAGLTATTTTPVLRLAVAVAAAAAAAVVAVVAAAAAVTVAATVSFSEPWKPGALWKGCFARLATRDVACGQSFGSTQKLAQNRPTPRAPAGLAEGCALESGHFSRTYNF